MTTDSRLWLLIPLTFRLMYSQMSVLSIVVQLNSNFDFEEHLSGKWTQNRSFVIIWIKLAVAADVNDPNIKNGLIDA